MMPEDAIITFSGRVVRPLALTEADVCLADIAHSLAMQCRWTGHVRTFYSVAEHSLLMSEVLAAEGHSEHALWGLLHDAPEAYLVDLAKPMKGTPGFNEFRQIERRVMDVICGKFGLERGEPAQVKRVDGALLSTEYRDIMNHTPLWHPVVPPIDDLKIDPLPPGAAKYLFLGRFHQLTAEKWKGRELE